MKLPRRQFLHLATGAAALSAAWQLSKLETSASTACARSARAPLRKISVS